MTQNYLQADQFNLECSPFDLRFPEDIANFLNGLRKEYGLFFIECPSILPVKKTKNTVSEHDDNTSVFFPQELEFRGKGIYTIAAFGLKFNIIPPNLVNKYERCYFTCVKGLDKNGKEAYLLFIQTNNRNLISNEKSLEQKIKTGTLYSTGFVLDYIDNLKLCAIFPRNKNIYE